MGRVSSGYRCLIYCSALGVSSLPRFSRDAPFVAGGSSPVGNALVFDTVCPDFDPYDPSENANWQYHYDIGEDTADCRLF
jgi:hypothetical protein